MKTYSQSVEEAQKNAKWRLVDATGIPVGRIATRVASLIRGKMNPEFTPHANGGDFVIVINAAKAIFSGKKLDQKVYYHHTGYPGGIKGITAGEMMDKTPERVIESAVKGMIQRGALGHQMIKKLKVYSGSEHPHQAQNPEVFEIVR